MENNDKDRALQQREKALQEKEQELRLRELEAEIFRESHAQEPPIYQTQKEQPTKNQGKPWPQKLMTIVKFFVLMVTIFVAVKIAYWVALGIIIGSIAWMSYKLFLEGDRK